ncbi:MAG: HD domain-containing protein [Firmicutes bacterium]|nr:HD domain-containing protein [Bacillota bacterium]
MKLTTEQLKNIEKTKEFVKSIMTDDMTGHDYFHVLRVYHMASFLAKGEDINSLILFISALLHDVDDLKLFPKDSKNAENFLKELTITLEEKTEILSIIENMSYSASLEGKSVSSLEGQIVQDADRLDAIGAIGIARCFAYGASKGRRIYNGDVNDDSSLAHFYQKLLKLPDLMNTLQAKRIARTRIRVLNNFLAEFHNEWNIIKN